VIEALTSIALVRELCPAELTAVSVTAKVAGPE